MSLVQDCGCVYDLEEVDCRYCDGTGEDQELSGIGFCGFCSGRGWNKEHVVDYLCEDHDGEFE